MQTLLLAALAMGVHFVTSTASGQQSAPVSSTPAAEEIADTDIDLLKQAAQDGNANAQFNLGLMYLTGTLPKDATEAEKWLKRGADRGDMGAQFILGCLYDTPERVGVDAPRDAKQAVQWYRQAAEQGLAMAQFFLISKYREGDGVPQDYVQAYFWANVFAADPIGTGTRAVQPSPEARRASEKFAALARESRDSVARFMTLEQIAEAQRLSREFRPKKWRPPGEQADGGDAQASGTGFFITRDGYLITSQHVVAKARRIQVRVASTTYTAVVVRQDSSNDLALLKVLPILDRIGPGVASGVDHPDRAAPIEPPSFPALAVCGSTGVRAAEQVFTIGFPNPELQGNSPKFSSGEVAALTGPDDDPRFFQISVPVQPGNSGGPLVDSAGSVVGIVAGQLDKIATLKATGNLPENVNYAVKSSLLLALLESVPEIQDKLEPPQDVGGDDRATVGQRVAKAICLVIVDQ